MDVATIVQRVIDLGLNEDAPDTDLQTKALGWVNSAYKEAYNLAATYSWPILYTSATVTITNGVGTLPAAPKRILQIRDTATNRILKPSDYLYVTSIDADANNVGNPARYYIAGSETALRTHPVNSTSVVVNYIAKPADLLISSTETDIKIPAEHHTMLIWAALTEGLVYERGFGNDGMLQIATARKKELLDDYMRWLSHSCVREPQRVKYQDF